jgi:hypothetical protein
MTSSAGTSARSVQAVKTNVSDCASMTDVSTAKMATFSSSSAPMNTHRLNGDIPAADFTVPCTLELIPPERSGPCFVYTMPTNRKR